MFISIEGSIASGKSTTARLVAESLGFSLVHEESHRHPFLGEFYSNPTEFALETELAFVLIHYHQLKPLGPAQSTVSDFSPVKDLVFAEMNLSGDDLALFKHNYEYLVGRLAIPEFVVFLDLEPELLQRRAQARGRPFELNLPLEYLVRLRESYANHMQGLGAHVEVLQVSEGQSQSYVATRVRGLLETR